MGKFKFIETDLKDLWIIEPKVFGDERGFFMEFYNKQEFEEAGIKVNFVQDNHSRSTKGVLRGLHFQKKHPQGKLVKVVRGAAYDVAVDLRPNSPTFGKWFSVILTEDNHRMLYIPEGFAHGFLALTDVVDFLYKVTDFYHPEDEGGIIWNDPDLNIKWPFEEYGIKESVMSQKDKQLKRFAEQDFEFFNGL